MNFTDKITALYEKNKAYFKKHNIKLSADTPLEFMAEAKLMDGTVIKSTAAEWGAGADAYMIDADGVETPLAAGSYELEGGLMLVIGDDGLVAEVKEVEVEEEEMSAEDARELIAALSARNTELETQLAAANATKETTSTELGEVKVQLSAKTAEVERLKKKPAATSVTEDFSAAASTTKEADLVQRIKNKMQNKSTN